MDRIQQLRPERLESLDGFRDIQRLASGVSGVNTALPPASPQSKQ